MGNAPSAIPAGTTVHSFSVAKKGAQVPLSNYKGKVLVVFNSAAQCGYTPQLAGLQGLYAKYNAKGLEVLSFPSNDFFQDRGSEESTETETCTRYKTTFPIFARVSVGGATQDPLFAYLTSAPGVEGKVGWNFTKWLIGADGIPIKRYATGVAPEAMEPDIVAALAAASAVPLEGDAAAVSGADAAK